MGKCRGCNEVIPVNCVQQNGYHMDCFESRPIKVFKVNYWDWYAAASTEEAIAQHLADYGVTREEYDELDECVELTQEQMQNFDLTDEYERKISFKDQLQKMIKEGVKFPCLFASTEY